MVSVVLIFQVGCHPNIGEPPPTTPHNACPAHLAPAVIFFPSKREYINHHEECHNLGHERPTTRRPDRPLQFCLQTSTGLAPTAQRIDGSTNQWEMERLKGGAAATSYSTRSLKHQSGNIAVDNLNTSFANPQTPSTNLSMSYYLASQTVRYMQIFLAEVFSCCAKAFDRLL